MKNLLLTITVFSALLLIGCQENSITDPIQDVELQKTDDPLVHRGTIVLEDMLTDPNPVMNSYYLISGEIEYQHIFQFLDPIPPNPQYLVSLNLSVSADFTYYCTVCSPQTNEASAGTISLEVNDAIYVTGDGTYLLEKSFPIQGREDGMILMCKFLVTTDGIGLSEMWLELEDGNSTVNNLNKNVEHEPVTDPLVHITEFD